MPRARPHTISDNLLAGVAIVAGALWSMLWSSAALTSRLSGHPAPRASLTFPIEAFAHAGNPAQAWGQPVGPAPLYWAITLAAITIGLGASGGIWLWIAKHASRGEVDSTRLIGTASHRDVARVAGRRWLLKRGNGLRPSLARPHAADLGYRLGRSRRRRSPSGPGTA